MGFTETVFLFAFLPLSILLYVLADKLFHNDKVNNLLLVLFSIVFYYWAHKESLFIFVVIILFTYMAGNTVNTDTVGKNKRLQFFLVIILGVLAYYKYITFIGSLLDDLTARPIISVGELIVPIGISFTVFESISYVIDIYRGDAQAGTLLECFTFMSLFPKLVSGPIVLWKDFHHQLIGRRTSLEKIAYGIDRIIIGYAKKVILADSFGQQIMLINSEISNGGVDTPTMWIRALLYFFQLYIDFSGYSDIAIGLCNIFGFSIKENFRFPYLSKSITEFWRRWHISLGTWFREYVYIPLGGNQKGNVYIHLIIVFILTGIWHGAGWPFLLWGAAHAVLVAFERAISDKTWYKKSRPHSSGCSRSLQYT
ncbi:MAG: MBOAT family protein [Firmicutes bacterium]|nr:MBOAT family protein [Bacillota bacterium]